MSKKEEVEISAEQFLKHARHYQRAAEILTEHLSTPTVGPISLLAAHSLELALKAFLLHNGWSEKQLRKHGHEIDDLVTAAEAAGLWLGREPSATVMLLAAAHSPPYPNRYPQKGKPAALPSSRAQIKREVNAVLDAVERAIVKN